MNIMQDAYIYPKLCDNCSHVSCCSNWLSPIVLEKDKQKFQNNKLGIEIDKYLQPVTILGKTFNEIKKKQSPEHDMECIFWDSKNGCKIFEYRPLDCRMFPFDIVEIDGLFHWVLYSCNPSDIKTNWDWTEEYLVNLENESGFSEVLDNAKYFADISRVKNYDDVGLEKYVVLREVNRKNV